MSLLPSPLKSFDGPAARLTVVVWTALRLLAPRAVVQLPLDRAGPVCAGVGRIRAERLERDVLEHLFVVRERVDARQRQRIGRRIVGRRDAGAGKAAGGHREDVVLAAKALPALTRTVADG